MNINIFFIAISAGLISIYLFFKPLDIKQRDFIDIPIFELSYFTLYEIDKNALVTVMNGDKAVRYSNRYKVSSIDYTDNSKKYLVNMKANNGVFKDEVVNLYGDVKYKREDGLSFETQKARYNKKTKIAYVDTNYVSHMGANEIVGSSLIYNNLLKRVKSTDIRVKYQLKEGSR